MSPSLSANVLASPIMVDEERQQMIYVYTCPNCHRREGTHQLGEHLCRCGDKLNLKAELEPTT
jgi:hypothetical protein